jgi:hypothetical protein
VPWQREALGLLNRGGAAEQNTPVSESECATPDMTICFDYFPFLAP